MKNITIPNSVNSICNFALFSSYNLRIVTDNDIIGESVKRIEAYSFEKCDHFQCIYFLGQTEPSMHKFAFCDKILEIIAMTLDS